MCIQNDNQRNVAKRNDNTIKLKEREQLLKTVLSLFF